jgi:hypothetical protein
MISLGVGEVLSLGDAVSVPSPSTCRPIVTRVTCSKAVLPFLTRPMHSSRKVAARPP